MEIDGCVVLITGGKRIGHAVAQELAQRGADLALSYRGSLAEAEDTAAGVRRLGRRAAVIEADLSRAADAAALVDRTVAELGRLDVLINMASVYRPVPFDTMTEADWQLDLDVNLSAAFHCASAAVPHLRRQGRGRIINFADWVARSGRPAYPGFVAYYTAKAGVIALTEALALELARDQILVNAIAPGPIMPPPDLSADERNAVAGETPLGRWGGALEIAKTVRALIESDFITGETVRVDGGRHVR